MKADKDIVFSIAIGKMMIAIKKSRRMMINPNKYYIGNNLYIEIRSDKTK
jgi:hypothetical protein